MSPLHFQKLSATDGTVWDLNIGVSPGLAAMIQGQIYNPAWGFKKSEDAIGVVGM